MNEEEPVYVIEDDELNDSAEFGCKYIHEFISEYCLFKGDYDSILLEGSNGGWQGRREIVPTLISEIEDFTNRVEFDIVNISFYKDRVEVSNSHHDGVNYYVLKPFRWDDLKIEELKNVIVNDGLFDDYKDYIDEVKRKDIRKYHYVEFLQNVFDSETIDTGKPNV